MLIHIVKNIVSVLRFSYAILDCCRIEPRAEKKYRSQVRHWGRRKEEGKERGERKKERDEERNFLLEWQLLRQLE